MQSRNSPKLLDDARIDQSEEVGMLRKNLKRARERSSVEVVLIEGQSGTGKSYLSKLAFPPDNQEVMKHVLFASAKIERGQDSSPLAGIRTLVEHVLDNDKAYDAVRRNEDKFTIQQRESLTQLLPKKKRHVFESYKTEAAADDVAHSHSNSTSAGGSSVGGLSANSARRRQTWDLGRNSSSTHAIELALKTFFQVVLSRSEKDEYGKGLSMVLWLDDIMWCPKPTFDILHYVLSECKLKRVLFCATYRGEKRPQRFSSMQDKGSSKSLIDVDDEYNDASIRSLPAERMSRDGAMPLMELLDPPPLRIGQKKTDMMSDTHVLLQKKENDTWDGRTRSRLAEWILNLEKAATENKNREQSALAAIITIHRIMLKGLTPQRLEDFLVRTLRREARDLAEFVQFCTRGNLFYVIQLLEQMQAMNHITYDYATDRWTYSLMDIKKNASLSKDIGAVIASRIQFLRKEMLEVLMLSSCFGSVVAVHLLDITKSILDEKVLKSDKGWTLETIKQFLREASEAQLLIQTSDTLFRFAHEEIRLAAYNLLPEGPQRRLYHWQIASLFLKSEELQSVENADQAVLFSCCDHLRESLDHVQTESERAQISKLFLEAGERAATVSAFFPAADYFRLGIKTWNLDSVDFFRSQHHIAFHLYLALARAEYSSGVVDESMKRTDFVLKQAKTQEEKHSAVLLKLRILLAANHHMEHLEYGLSLLEQLDPAEQLPMRPTNAQASVRKIKSTLKGVSKDELLDLPSKDVDKEDVLQILREIWQSSSQLENTELRDVIRARIIRIALKNGTERYLTFVLLLMSSLFLQDDLKQSLRFVRIADALARHSPFPDTRAFVLFSGIKAIFEPPTKTLDYCLSGYKVCMDSGDIYQAMSCITMYSLTYYYSGIPFQNLIDDMSKFENQMVQYGQTFSFLVNLPHWQCLLNLSGQSKVDPLNVNEGEAMDKAKQVKLHRRDIVRRDVVNRENSREEQAKKGFQLFACVLKQKRIDPDSESQHTKPGIDTEKTTVSAQQMALIHNMELAFYFGDLRRSTLLCSEVENFTHDTGILAMAPVVAHNVMFFSALIYICNARLSVKDRRKYLPLALKTVTQLRGLCESGALHVVHKFIICQAELASLHGEEQSVHGDEQGRLIRSKYLEGISAAGRGGYVQDAALGSYLLAKFCEHRPELSGFVETHMGDAFDFYTTWGADAVADSLKKRNARYFRHGHTGTGAANMGTGFLNRQRFTEISKGSNRFTEKSTLSFASTSEEFGSPKIKHRPTLPSDLSHFSLGVMREDIECT